MHYNYQECWYVLRIRSKFYQLVERSLNHKQFGVLNPTYQVRSPRKDRKKILQKPIFNGYLFVQTRLNPEIHLELLKTHGVIEVLKNSRGPIPVPDEQIQNITILENHLGQCFYSPEFAKGDLVQIHEGVLKGLIGYIDQVNRSLLRISIDAIPGSIMIEVTPHEVELLEKVPLFSALAANL